MELCVWAGRQGTGGRERPSAERSAPCGRRAPPPRACWPSRRHAPRCRARRALGRPQRPLSSPLPPPPVDGGERAVIFDRFSGVLPDVVGEGTHFRLPWVQTPHIMDVRTRPRTISSVTGTKDLQMVNMSLRLLSKPAEDKLPTIFKVGGGGVLVWLDLGGGAVRGAACDASGRAKDLVG